MSIKLDRLNNNFMEKISEILHNEVKDKNVKLVTITDVKITSDLSFAKVYFTSLDDDKKKVTDALNKVSGFVRSELCNRVKIRKMPEISFLYDESIDYGKKIENILERINNEE